MDDSRYLECLAADYGDLRDAAAAVELTVPVPTCPGWTMGDLVFHVAEVYLHKVTVMRTGEWPKQWPPPGAEHAAKLPLLGRAYGELIAEFSARRPTDPTPTWYDPDQTVAFWIRRMAQETVMHRIDAELAAGLPVTPVPDDLALDGVDEVLKRFLGYDAEDLDQLEGGHLARRRPGHDHGAGGPDRVDGPSVAAGGRGRRRRQRQPARGDRRPRRTPCCAGCGGGRETG